MIWVFLWAIGRCRNTQNIYLDPKIITKTRPQKEEYDGAEIELVHLLLLILESGKLGGLELRHTTRSEIAQGQPLDLN